MSHVSLSRMRASAWTRRVALLTAASLAISTSIMGCGGNAGGQSTGSGGGVVSNVTGRTIKFGVARASDGFTVAAVNNPGVIGQETFEVEVPQGAKSLMIVGEDGSSLSGASVSIAAPAARGPNTRVTLGDGKVSVEGGTAWPKPTSDDPEEYAKQVGGLKNLTVAPPTGQSRYSAADVEDTSCPTCEAPNLSSVVINPAPGTWKVAVNSRATSTFRVAIAVVDQNGLSGGAEENVVERQAYEKAGLSDLTTRSHRCSYWVRAGIWSACMVYQTVGLVGGLFLLSLLSQTGLGFVIAVIGGELLLTVWKDAIRSGGGCDRFVKWVCSRI